MEVITFDCLLGEYMNLKMHFFLSRLSTLLLIAVLCLMFQCISISTARASDSPNPPSSVVKLIFIHHSTGEGWLNDDNGGLGIALSQNNYFVSDTYYGWGPNSIGDRTDIPDWLDWFRSGNTATYMAALYNESDRRLSYTRGTLSDPGGENEIIMFKSCFPNSALEGHPDDPPSLEGWLTVGHAKYVYNQLLLYFEAHPDKLFVVITAPPLSDLTYATNARAFNQWLMNDWLGQNNYTLKNVAIFDFYNVLTGPDNHHRFYNNAVQHIITQNNNTLYYPSGDYDDHPSKEGNLKATNEFVTLLNVFYHRWKNDIIAPVTTTGMSTKVTSGSATLNGTVNPNGLSTTYYFEWGATTAYGNTIPSTPASAGSGTTGVHVSADITGLSPDTLYHYRLVAVSSAGTSYGSDRIIEKAHGQPYLMLLLE
jgi:hypothetical protein